MDDPKFHECMMAAIGAEAVAGLAKSLWPLRPLDRCLLMAISSAYFDESGGDDDSMLFMGGVIADVDCWQKLSQGLGDWLGDRAAKFKAHTATPGELCEAARLVSEYAAHGVVVSIDPPTYRSIASERFRSQQGSEYTLALKEATKRIGMWLDGGDMNDPVGYVFDGGHKNAGQAYDYFSKVYNKYKNERKHLRLSTWSFGDDEIIWPLKAADILAYVHRRYRDCGDCEEAYRYVSGFRFIEFEITAQGIEHLIHGAVQVRQDRKRRRKALRAAYGQLIEP